jgi:hypothetical protein
VTSAISRALDYDTLIREAIDDGGFTVAVASGEQPRTGYAFSPYPERSYTVPTDVITADDIRQYAGKNADLLALPDHYLGAWRDTSANDTVWLDISIIAPDLPAAEVLGRAYDQIAVYDLSAQREVRL